jgi:flagellar motility protein MotE (MotC chaperone)
MEMPSRKPKRKLNIVGLIRNIVLPIAAIGALVGAILWPPSHKIIFEGPLKPMLAKVQPFFDQAEKPLHFVAQQQTITEKNREIQALDRQLEQARKDLASRDDRIKALQGQLNTAQNAGAAAAASAPTPAPARPAGGAQTVAAAGAEAGGAAGPVDPDIKRTAAVWAQMGPDSVAGLAQKLPVDYVVRVMGQMSPDQVGQVMEALPPDLAAKITQARAPH